MIKHIIISLIIITAFVESSSNERVTLGRSLNKVQKFADVIQLGTCVATGFFSTSNILSCASNYFGVPDSPEEVTKKTIIETKCKHIILKDSNCACSDPTKTSNNCVTECNEASDCSVCDKTIDDTCFGTIISSICPDVITTPALYDYKTPDNPTGWARYVPTRPLNQVVPDATIFIIQLNELNDLKNRLSFMYPLLEIIFSIENGIEYRDRRIMSRFSEIWAFNGADNSLTSTNHYECASYMTSKTIESNKKCYETSSLVDCQKVHKRDIQGECFIIPTTGGSICVEGDHLIKINNEWISIKDYCKGWCKTKVGSLNACVRNNFREEYFNITFSTYPVYNPDDIMMFDNNLPISINDIVKFVNL